MSEKVNDGIVDPKVAFSPENNAAAAELEAEILQDEAKEAQAKDAVAKKFDIRALAASTRKTQVILDPLGREIRYGILTRGEVKVLQLEKIVDQELFVDNIVFAMLKKADPKLSRVDFDDLPVDAKGVLLQTLTKVFTGFLPNQLPSGSAPQTKPKQ